LPAVRYFVDRFSDSPWGIYVFITDGELHDLDAVKAYSTQLARAVAEGRRNPLKFVLIGIGSDISEAQMEELDDLDTGTPIDLWDHKLAAEMRMLQEIFAEVVDKNSRVADHGRILDMRGQVVKDYSDTGLPAFLEFEMPAGNDYFTLEVNGSRIHQGLFDKAIIPASSKIPQAAPVAPPVSKPVQAARAKDADIPLALPADEGEGKGKTEDEDWKDIDLVLDNDKLDIDFGPTDKSK
jgi:hypothetical protein